jgi:hypothetical protein
MLHVNNGYEMVKQWKDRTGDWSSGPIGMTAVYRGLVFGQTCQVQANKTKSKRL